MYAVIFSSRLTEDASDYETTADRMVELSASQPGFVSVQSVRDPSGRGITVCMWDSLEAIARWREQAEHVAAQRVGMQRWYAEYELTICEVLEAH